MIKKVLACLIFLLCSFILLPVISGRTLYASDYEIPKASEGQVNEALQKIVPLRFLPGHPLYFLIFIKEGFNAFFQPSSVKVAQFEGVLASKRLKEVYMLIVANQDAEASKNLLRYSQSNKRVIDRLNKALGQKQEVTPLAGEIAEDLKSQEVLLFAITLLDGDLLKDSDFSKNFDEAVNSFIEVAKAINDIKPGLKDRFKTVSSQENSRNQELREATASATPEPRLFESSASVKPKRIIY